MYNFFTYEVTRTYKIIFTLWILEWSILLYFFNFFSNITFSKLFFIVFVILSHIISITIFFQHNKKSIFLSKILLIIFWISYGLKETINFFYNIFLFSFQSELYLNSPATIFIVIIKAIAILFFPIILSVSSYVTWYKGVRSEKNGGEHYYSIR